MPVVLGIDAPPPLVEAWVQWIAPDPQPFLVDPAASWSDCHDEGGSLTKELEDTYRLWWGVAKGCALMWISEEQFGALPKATRASLVREQVRRRRGAVPTVRAFDAWISAACTPGGDPRDLPGVVLMWRNRDGAPVHAAVSIGGGWGLEKPSGDWHSPRAVVSLADIMRMSRHPGERVERHTIAP